MFCAKLKHQMLTLVFIIIFGIAFSYFATLNTGSVSVNFDFYQAELPIYLALLLSLGFGMLLAAFIYLLRYLSDRMTIGETEKNLNDANKRITELTKELHKLELENTKLKSENGTDDIDEDSLE